MRGPTMRKKPARYHLIPTFHLKNPRNSFLISNQPPIIPDTIIAENVGLQTVKIQKRIIGIN